MKTTFGWVCVAGSFAAFALGSIGRVFAQAPVPSAAPAVAESASAAPVASEQAPPASAGSAARPEMELVIPPDCPPGFGLKSGQCTPCDPPCAPGAVCMSGPICVPGTTCAKGSVLTHEGCVPSERVFSRKKDVCEPPCAAGKVCRGPNRCGPPERNPYLHDGVYFRAGAGVGFGAVSKKTDGLERETGSGVAPAFELALGGAPTPGFVFGVGVYGARIDLSNPFDYATLVGAGPFVDVYPLPRENFHVQAAVTYDTLLMSLSQPVPVPSPFCSSPCNVTTKVDFDGGGFGLMWGIGFEGWTSPQVAAGILIRVQYFSTTVATDSAAYPNATASVVVPALLLTLTAQ